MTATKTKTTIINKNYNIFIKVNDILEFVIFNHKKVIKEEKALTGKEGYYKNNILWDKKNNFFNKISLEIFSLFFFLKPISYVKSSRSS